MSINAVQQYCKGLLDGLSLPVAMGGMAGAGGDQLTAIITPPVNDARTTPRVYIWGSNGHEALATMPGGPGNRKVDYKIYMWIVAFADLDTFADDDALFPSILDEIMFTIRNSPVPVLALPDGTTGRTSDILAIGQNMSWDYAPVTTIDENSSVARFDGRVVVDVVEWVHT